MGTAGLDKVLTLEEDTREDEVRTPAASVLGEGSPTSGHGPDDVFFSFSNLSFSGLDHAPYHSDPLIAASV